MIKHSLRAAIAAATILLFSVSAHAGSIFDDDFPGKEEPAAHPAPKLAPAPEPKPTPVPEEPKEVTPTPPPATPIGESPADAAMEKKKTEDLLKAQQKEAAEREAQISKAEADLAAAKAAAEKQANESPDYIKATSAADEAKKAYDEAKTAGNADDTAAAFNSLSKALLDKTAIYKRLISENKSYQQARTNASAIGIALDATAGQSGVAADKQKEDVPQPIADAIASHNLIEGMTLRQAKQASRKPCEFVGGAGTTKTYRWNMKGRTGKTITETHVDRLGHRKTEATAEYGVIGYVEATFVDDKLTTYAKYSLIAYANGKPKKVAGN